VSKIVAIAGKGGTGKTTVAALLIHYLLRAGKVPVLAVDADADSNLPDALGIAAGKTIGTIGNAREEFFKQKGEVPAGMPKEAWLELQLNQVLVETKAIDLLVMGRPEGAGCYCYINNVLRKYLDMLGKNYPFVIVDNEAGLEHLSRRTTQNVDYLMIVSDYSINGLRAADRIGQLAAELKLNVGNLSLIINNAPETVSEHFMQELEKTGLQLCGMIPHDETVMQHDVDGKSLLELSEESPALTAVNAIAQDMFGK